MRENFRIRLKMKDYKFDNMSDKSELHTLSDLVEELQQIADQFEFLTKDGAVDCMNQYRDLLKMHGINVNYEHPRVIDELSSKKLPPRIRFTLSNDNKLKSEFDSNVNRFTNGMTLQIVERGGATPVIVEVISIPASSFSTNGNKPALGPMLKYFNVVPIEEGTTVTYYWDNVEQRWTMSTRNSWMAEELVWRGYKYGDTFAECIKIVTGLDYAGWLDTLNKEHSYSIGFKHPAYNYLGQPTLYTGDITAAEFKVSAWLIKVAKLSDGTDAVLEDVGGLKFQETIDISMNEMCAKMDNSIDSFVATGVPCLGYILRAKPDAPVEIAKDYIFESKLWKEVRMLWYQSSSKTMRDINSYAAKSKFFEYMMFYNVMNRRRNKMLKQLYPQLAGQITETRKKFFDVVVAIYNGCTRRGSVKGTDKKSSILAYLIKYVSSQYKTGTNRRTDLNVIEGMLYDGDYYNTVYDYYN